MKTVSLPVDLIRATIIYLALQRGKHGNSTKDFSAAVAQGLNLVMSRNKTSVPKLLGTISAE